MSFLRLLPQILLPNLSRKPVRLALTLVSLAVAFLLFVLLRAVVATFTGETTGPQRLMTDAKYAMTDNLPLTAVAQIRELPGVAAVTQFSWFGGYYQHPDNDFAKTPVDHHSFFDVFPELVVSEATLQRFAASPRAVVAEARMAASYGWQVGDVIPITGDIWPKEDGSWGWQFQLAGTYEIPEGKRLQPWFLLRYDYFNESVIDWAKHQVGWIYARLDPDADIDAVRRSIDAGFENSSDPTQTLSEDEYAAQFAQQLGDIGAISAMVLCAVFFTLLLLTSNVVGMSLRERTGELAVLKTLGFGDVSLAALVFLETLLMCVLGAAIGIAGAYALEPLLQAELAASVGGFGIVDQDAGVGLAIAIALGVLIGASPAWRTHRVDIVACLARLD